MSEQEREGYFAWLGRVVERLNALKSLWRETSPKEKSKEPPASREFLALCNALERYNEVLDAFARGFQENVKRVSGNNSYGDPEEYAIHQNLVKETKANLECQAKNLQTCAENIGNESGARRDRFFVVLQTAVERRMDIPSVFLEDEEPSDFQMLLRVEENLYGNTKEHSTEHTGRLVYGFFLRQTDSYEDGVNIVLNLSFQRKSRSDASVFSFAPSLCPSSRKPLWSPHKSLRSRNPRVSY